jgi:hypothetical protein
VPLSRRFLASIPSLLVDLSPAIAGGIKSRFSIGTTMDSGYTTGVWKGCPGKGYSEDVQIAMEFERVNQSSLLLSA